MRVQVVNLAGLARTLRALSEVPSQVARDASDRINVLIQAGFDKGADPYDKAWEELKQSTLDKGRSPPPLTDSHTMRDGTIATPSAGSGIELAAPSPANFHQSGTRFMARRRVLPDSGLPATWRAAIQAATSEAVAKRMGK